MRSTRRPAALAASLVVLLVGGMLASGVDPALAAPTPTPSGAATSSAAPTPKPSAESWSATPAQLRTSNALRTTFFMDGQPGTTLYDALQISNSTGKALPVTIYASDAGNTPKGGNYTVRPIADKMTEVGTWVTPQQRKVVVPKGKGLKVPFKVTIPKSAAPGDHVGGMVTLGTTPKGDGKSSQVLIQRAIAVRMIVRVGGFNTNAMVVDNVTLKAKAATLPFAGGKGNATVTYTYRNAGTVTVRPKATIKLTGLFGRVLHTTEPVALPETYPGQSVTLTKEFLGMPSVDRVEARVELVDAGLPSRAIAGSTAAGDDTKWVISLVVLLILLFLIAGLVAYFVRRDRQRSGRPGPAAPQPVPAGGIPAAPAAPVAGAAAGEPGRRRAEGGRRRRGGGGAG